MIYTISSHPDRPVSTAPSFKGYLGCYNKGHFRNCQQSGNDYDTYPWYFPRDVATAKLVRNDSRAVGWHRGEELFPSLIWNNKQSTCFKYSEQKLGSFKLCNEDDANVMLTCAFINGAVLVTQFRSSLDSDTTDQTLSAQ